MSYLASRNPDLCFQTMLITFSSPNLLHELNFGKLLISVSARPGSSCKSGHRRVLMQVRRQCCLNIPKQSGRINLAQVRTHSYSTGQINLAVGVSPLYLRGVSLHGSEKTERCSRSSCKFICCLHTDFSHDQPQSHRSISSDKLLYAVTSRLRNRPRTMQPLVFLSPNPPGALRPGQNTTWHDSF